MPFSLCVICGKELPRKTSRCCGPPGSDCYRESISRSKCALPWPESFWARARKQEDGCWIWTGATRGHMGYGAAQHRALRRLEATHRISWMLTHGEIPQGMFVLHHCDVPLCVNPEHLYLGSALDNMRDKCERGRRPTVAGAANPRSFLTPEKVAEIRARYAAGGVSQQRLADEYGVHQTTISHAIIGMTWKET